MLSILCMTYAWIVTTVHFAYKHEKFPCMMMAYPSQTIFIAMKGNGNIMFVCVNAVCAVLIPCFSALFYPSKGEGMRILTPILMRHFCILSFSCAVLLFQIRSKNQAKRLCRFYFSSFFSLKQVIVFNICIG